MKPRPNLRALFTLYALLTLLAFGLGFAVGEPNQITGKYFTNGQKNAVQFGAAWSFRTNWFVANVDYVYQFWDVIPKIADGAIEVPIYVGAGGVAWIDLDGRSGRRLGDPDRDTSLALGARVPVGIALAWTRVPIEVFIEVAPYIFVFPSVRGDLGGVLGGRWYF
jgi:hypothetical protein